MPAVTGDPFTSPETEAPGTDRVDEADLRERERLVQRADGHFLTNVVGAFTEDRLPSDLDLCGGVFEFDAQFRPGKRSAAFDESGAGGISRNTGGPTILKSAERRTGPSFGHQLKHTAVERQTDSREVVGQALPAQRPATDGPGRGDGSVRERNGVVVRTASRRLEAAQRDDRTNSNSTQ